MVQARIGWRPAPRALAVGASAACAALLTAACAAGPDFQKPAAPDVAGYTPKPVAATAATEGVAGGAAQRFTSGADIPADWWSLFHSPALNALIVQALAENHDLKAARAALLQAHETRLAQRGAYYPNVQGSFSATRQKQSADLAPTPADNALQYSLFTPQVAVSYTPDVFGLVKRTVEQAQAQEDAARYQMIATYLTLTSNVAAAAIQEAAIEAQVDATRDLIDIDGRIVATLRDQFGRGYASRADLAAQEAQLAQAQANLPPLLKQQAQQQDQIAVLSGRYPSQGGSDRFTLASLTLPADLPLSLPSQLVEQRPDVLQAEANMHAASAAIGIAEANRLPNLQLTGNIGSMAAALDQVFAAGTGFWGVGATAAGTLFDGGTLRRQAAAAKAAYTQAAEQYRSTVLTAFQNVADTLNALDQDAAGLQAAAVSETAAKTSLDLAQTQVKDGYAGALVLLNAQQAYQQARLARVQAEAARFADTAALFQALGGGWWRRTDLASNSR